ncbi:MAG TPA: dehydrogenase [Candidatus Latescibacteria bacterium]|jgi:uncharacterized oxidoreductase|nr:dehydrogenase [Candidatus Latescibacterota bacterium]
MIIFIGEGRFMPNIQHEPLRILSRALYEAVGVPSDQAKIMTDHLVDANLFGHDSHGSIRTPGYLKSLQAGNHKPVSDLNILRESSTTAVIDAEHSLGIVIAHRAMQMAVDKAKQHSLGAVAVHQSSHIGRLGDYPPIAAEQECIGLLLLNGGGRFTAPFGGTARRLPPNPIAASVPTPNGKPLMLDITTSMAAGGKVEVFRARGEELPEGWLINDKGEAVTDPNAFGDGNVAMLPLGGPMGHKGYGLATMIDAIAGGLSWAGCSADPPTRGGSGFIAMAIKIEAFIDLDEYLKEIGILCDWIKSSPTAPGFDKVYLPGEIEWEKRARREDEGIYIEDETWGKICESAEELNVPIPKGLPAP